MDERARENGGVNQIRSATPAASPHHRLADVVSDFVAGVEELLDGPLAHPFNIGSDALRDCADHADHPGVYSQETLRTLALSQVVAGFEQCDMFRGIAGCLRADKVFFAPFPLARTAVVLAAKARYVLVAGSRVERLQRYLNEEIEGVHEIPDLVDTTLRPSLQERIEDYMAVGASAGLVVGRRSGRQQRPWHAPFLVRPDQPLGATPPSESALVRELFGAAGLDAPDVAAAPYSVLSASAHGRFRRSGVATYSARKTSDTGVRTTSMHTPANITAGHIIYAGWATLTYLRALARYTSADEQLVLDRLEPSIAAWSTLANPDSSP